MKIEMGGKYVTRSTAEKCIAENRKPTPDEYVRILTVDTDNPVYPVVALIGCAERQRPESFTIDGCLIVDGKLHDLDLVPAPTIKTKRTITRYANVYRDSTSPDGFSVPTHFDENIARMDSGTDAIAVAVPVQITFEVEE